MAVSPPSPPITIRFEDAARVTVAFVLGAALAGPAFKLKSLSAT